MTVPSSTRLFILLGLAFSAVQTLKGLRRTIPTTGHELGFDGCSHEHFVIVDHFVQEEILKNISHAKLSYEFKQCRREAPVGSVFRNYDFKVQIGSALCKFSFSVDDVDTHITYANFTPLEVEDMNHCKAALHEAYIETSDLAPLFSEFDNDETSGLKPLFEGDDETETQQPVSAHVEALREVFETAPVEEEQHDDDEMLAEHGSTISIDLDDGEKEEEEIDYRTYGLFHHQKPKTEVDLDGQYNGIGQLFGEKVDAETETSIKQPESIKETNTISIQTDPIEEEPTVYDQVPKDYYTGMKRMFSEEPQVDPRSEFVGIKKLFEEDVDFDTQGIFEELEKTESHNEEPVEQIGSTEEIVFHNQKAGEQPADNEEKPIVHRDDPNDSRPIGSLVGGWNVCKKASKDEVKKVLVELANLGVMKGIYTYTENITSCKFQIVAGTNFDFKLEYNTDACNLSVFEALDGSLKLADGFKTTKTCGGYFTESYLAAHPELISA